MPGGLAPGEGPALAAAAVVGAVQVVSGEVVPEILRAHRLDEAEPAGKTCEERGGGGQQQRNACEPWRDGGQPRMVPGRRAQQPPQHAQQSAGTEPSPARPRRRAQELVAEEGLVGPLPRQDRPVSGFAHAAGEQIARDAVRVVLERLGVPDRVGEMVGQRRVVQHDHGVVRSRRGRHLARARGFVVLAALEPHREGRDRLVRARRGHAQRRR